jgi:hypothetical protein
MQDGFTGPWARLRSLGCTEVLYVGCTCAGMSEAGVAQACSQVLPTTGTYNGGNTPAIGTDCCLRSDVNTGIQAQLHTRYVIIT